MQVKDLKTNEPAKHRTSYVRRGKKSKQSNWRLNALTLLVQFLPSTVAQICLANFVLLCCLRSTKTSELQSLLDDTDDTAISGFPFLALRPLGLD